MKGQVICAAPTLFRMQEKIQDYFGSKNYTINANLQVVKNNQKLKSYKVEKFNNGYKFIFTII